MLLPILVEALMRAGGVSIASTVARPTHLIRQGLPQLAVDECGYSAWFCWRPSVVLAVLCSAEARHAQMSRTLPDTLFSSRRRRLAGSIPARNGVRILRCSLGLVDLNVERLEGALVSGIVGPTKVRRRLPYQRAVRVSLDLARAFDSRTRSQRARDLPCCHWPW